MKRAFSFSKILLPKRIINSEQYVFSYKHIKTISFILLFLICFCSYSQEQDNKLRFYSISFSPLSIYTDDNTGGVSFNLDLAFNVKKNIIKASLLSGSEFNILGRSAAFTEISTLYGRELLANNKVFKIDGFAGLGYIRYTYPDKSIDREKDYLKKNTISFPLQTRFRFQTGKSFSLGLQLHYSINAANSILNTSILLQWYL